MTTEIRERLRRDRERAERQFDAVMREFESGLLLEKINKLGFCSFVFTKFGEPYRVCERESGHSGGHLFGIARSLRRYSK